MREVKCSAGRIALVDDADYDLVSQYTWTSGNYPTTYPIINGKVTAIGMHQLILGIVGMWPQVVCDHRNRNKYDNQRQNLRLTSQSRNLANMRKHRNATSKYKGVSWHSKARKWVVQIQCDERHEYLGLFSDEEEAARVYDSAARERFGEFARVNFPQGDEVCALAA